MLCFNGFIWFHVKYSQLEAQLEATFFCLLDEKLCFKHTSESSRNTKMIQTGKTEHLHETTSWTEHRRTANW